MLVRFWVAVSGEVSGFVSTQCSENSRPPVLRLQMAGHHESREKEKDNGWGRTEREEEISRAGSAAELSMPHLVPTTLEALQTCRMATAAETQNSDPTMDEHLDHIGMGWFHLRLFVLLVRMVSFLTSSIFVLHAKM